MIEKHKQGISRREAVKYATGATAIPLAGCASNEGDDSGGQTDDQTGNQTDGSDDKQTNSDTGEIDFPDPTTLGYPAPVVVTFDLPLMPAFQDRLQEQAGVEMALKVFQGYTPMASSFIREESLMGFMSIPAFAAARAEGLPLVAVAGYHNQLAFPVVVAPEIESWSDIKGETFGAHTPNAMSRVAGEGILRRELDSLENVEIQYIPGGDNRLAALRSGELVATVLPLEMALQAEKEGTVKIMAHPKDYDDMNGITASVWATLATPTLEENPELLKRLVDFMAKSYDEVKNANPEEYTSEALTRGDTENIPVSFAELDDGVWPKALELAQDMELWPKGGAIEKEAFEKGQDLFVEIGMYDEEKRLNYDDAIEPLW